MARRSLVWLFDLDNTLHHASHAIFPAIAKNMTEFIVKMLDQGHDAAAYERANLLRLAYLHRFGATLKGVVDHHGVKAEVFLEYAHQFENLANMIRSERGLLRALSRLPGEKILFTNAPHQYSHAMMHHLGLRRYFSDHIAIEAMQVHQQAQPKPSKRFLQKFLAQRGLRASDCVLVEDSLVNLRAAKQLGMRTVWVSGYVPKSNTQMTSQWADIKVKSVFQLGHAYRRFFA
jgi:putative hydrolase of the HAD superfamily